MLVTFKVEYDSKMLLLT